MKNRQWKTQIKSKQKESIAQTGGG
jgi:hypothetical protein